MVDNNMALFVHLALAFILTAHAYGQAVFRRPPGSGPSRNYLDNPTYILGDKLQIIWEMEYNLTTLTMWHQDAYENFPQPQSAVILANTTKTNYTWTVSFDNFSSEFDPTLSNVYYFDLSDAEGNLGDITSHYFNISDSAKVSTSATPVATRIIYREKEQALSQGAIAGISVVATMIGMTIFGAIAFFAWKHFRRASPSEAEIGIIPIEPKSEAVISEMDSTSYHSQRGLSSEVTRYEVPG